MEESKKGSAGLTAEKSKALAAALAQIEKQFGKGSVMRLGAGEAVEDIQVVSTGSLGLDIALGVGGLPRGRVVEIYGPESSGKTTLTLQVVAEMQKLGGTAAFIDAEHALDIQYAAKLGVDVSELLVSQPDTGEQALEIADALVRSGSIDMIVIDSVTTSSGVRPARKSGSFQETAASTPQSTASLSASGTPSIRMMVIIGSRLATASTKWSQSARSSGGEVREPSS